MSVTCPAGHRSEATDYCDACGLRIDVDGEREPLLEPLAPAAEVPEAPTRSCPRCHEPDLSGHRFCEGCGFDFDHPDAAANPASPADPEGVGPDGVWEAVVRADRAFYDEVLSDGIEFPGELRERRIPLVGDRARIGRRRRTSTDSPEIDLAEPPEDTGVSHEHAELLRGEGGWTLIDHGSTNGTFLNRGAEAIEQNHPVELHEGDEIHLGAWTTITLGRAGAGSPTGPAG